MRAHKFIFFFLDSCVFLSFNCTIKWTIVNTITTEKKGRNAIEISQRRNIRKVEEKEKENQKRIKSFFVFFFFPFSLHSGFFVFFEFFVLVCWAMGFDEDVNETVDFLLGEDGVDSINDNNFTYDDGDDVIVDPNALLLDHNNNNHNNNDNIPLIIVAFKDKHGNLCLPKGISNNDITIPTPSSLTTITHPHSFSFFLKTNKRLFRGIRRICQRRRT